MEELVKCILDGTANIDIDRFVADNTEEYVDEVCNKVSENVGSFIIDDIYFSKETMSKHYGKVVYLNPSEFGARFVCKE